MNRLLKLIPALLLCTQVLASDNVVIYMKSTNSQTPIRLRFTFSDDSDDTGTVDYEHGNGSIPVKRVKERTLKKASGGRPWVFETYWVESLNGDKGGTYIITSQGAVIGDFTYKRKDGKTYKFIEDEEWRDTKIK